MPVDSLVASLQLPDCPLLASFRVFFVANFAPALPMFAEDEPESRRKVKWNGAVGAAGGISHFT